MTLMTLARAVGINHVSLEVGHIGEAIAFYAQFLSFEVDDLETDRCSLELGDQFIALTLGRVQDRDGYGYQQGLHGQIQHLPGQCHVQGAGDC